MVVNDCLVGSLHGAGSGYTLSLSCLFMGSCQLHSDTFDFVETYFVVTTVIELRCARAGMVCHDGRLLQRAALRHQGMVVNSKKLRRLMREHALQPKRRRRYVVTTDSDHDGPIFPDLAKEVAPDRPNQLWVADLTYISVSAKLAEGHPNRPWD